MYQKNEDTTGYYVCLKSLSCAVIVYISSHLSSANDMWWVSYNLRRAEPVQYHTIKCLCCATMQGLTG